MVDSQASGQKSLHEDELGQLLVIRSQLPLETVVNESDDSLALLSSGELQLVHAHGQGVDSGLAEHEEHTRQFVTLLQLHQESLHSLALLNRLAPLGILLASSLVHVLLRQSIHIAPESLLSPLLFEVSCLLPHFPPFRLPLLPLLLLLRLLRTLVVQHVPHLLLELLVGRNREALFALLQEMLEYLRPDSGLLLSLWLFLALTRGTGRNQVLWTQTVLCLFLPTQPANSSMLGIVAVSIGFLKALYTYIMLMFSKIKKGKKNHSAWLEQLETEFTGIDMKRARTGEREEILQMLERQESQQRSLMKKVSSKDSLKFIQEQEDQAKEAQELSRSLQQEREEKEQFKVMYTQNMNLVQEQQTQQTSRLTQQVNNFIQDLTMTFTEQASLIDSQASLLPSYTDIHSYNNEIKFLMANMQQNLGPLSPAPPPPPPNQSKKIEEQQEMLAQLQSQVETLLTSQQLSNAEASKQQEEIGLYAEQLQSYYTNLQNQKIQHQLKIDQMKGESSMLQEATDLQQTKLEEYYKQNNTLKTQALSTKEQLAKVALQQRQLQEMLLKKQAEIERLGKKVESVAEEVEPEEPVKSVASKESAEQKRRIEALESELAEQNGQMRSLYGEVEDMQHLKVKAETLQSALFSLQEQLDTSQRERDLQQESLAEQQVSLSEQSQAIQCLTEKRALALKQLSELKLEVDMQREKKKGQELKKVQVECLESGKMEVNVAELIEVLDQMKRVTNNAYKHFVLAVFDIADPGVRETMLPVEKSLNEVIRRMQELLDQLSMESEF